MPAPDPADRPPYAEAAPRNGLGCGAQQGPLYRLDGIAPRVGQDVFIAPTAAVIGNVSLGDGVSVWFSAVLRGDEMPITIGAGTNVQDGAVIHSTKGVADVVIGENVVIGHGAIIHGASVHDGAIIGMGAIILDGAIVEAGAIVAAGATVPPCRRVASGQLWMGAGGSVRRSVNPAERSFLATAPASYRANGGRYRRNGIGSHDST